MKNLKTYLFEGIVTPERAQISIEYKTSFTHLSTGQSGTAHINIILNKISIWADMEDDWNVYDLINTLYNIILNDLAIIGYLEGHYYSVDIFRAINRDNKIDIVFGIDIPCIKEINAKRNTKIEFNEIRNLCIGKSGIILRRSLRDLTSAMKNADDTGFYCYRSIESLKNHFVYENNIENLKEYDQWKIFRDKIKLKKDDIMEVKSFSDNI
ncbi:hypothetical protein [Microbaculum marinisediminis]|uniref:Uncharacterized protein n=1 Tax=Microbaculum marinisediminis TaxID=2931392 RepID=A0AAW5R2F1_9HYPH|nr:hypothetical protein [Microbaculum sp. A6E488]MCT8972838.1 hypothetical protein [Microbaculum sp. A6E488]